MGQLNDPFFRPTALDTFSVAERGFVVAGGTVGGISLFEIGPDGHLYFLTNAVDTVTATLASIAATEAVEVGREVQIFVSSATEPGLTQLSLNLGAIGSAIAPFGASSDAVGTKWDDFMSGDGRRNKLSGMDGNDRIVDGGGIDTLVGGMGADTFVFVRDGNYDRILDFQPGMDRIDLTYFERLYSTSSIDIVSTSYGARIDMGWDSILVSSQTREPLTAADFPPASFLF